MPIIDPFKKQKESYAVILQELKYNPKHGVHTIGNLVSDAQTAERSFQMTHWVLKE